MVSSSRKWSYSAIYHDVLRRLRLTERPRAGDASRARHAADSATQRALRLPEFVSAIVAELGPVSRGSSANAGYIHRLNAPYAVFDDNEQVIAAYGAHASLRAAALVNRTWCDAALPLL
jgi:hypothetical protein